MNFDPSSFSGKMFPDCYLPTMEEISQEFFLGWKTSGILADGACWMRDSMEFHSEDGAYSECSLADVLEPNVPQKYSLSPAACAGILRRAEKRNKKLPAQLEEALRAVAGATTPTE